MRHTHNYEALTLTTKLAFGVILQFGSLRFLWSCYKSKKTKAFLEKPDAKLGGLPLWSRAHSPMATLEISTQRPKDVQVPILGILALTDLSHTDTQARTLKANLLSPTVPDWSHINERNCQTAGFRLRSCDLATLRRYTHRPAAVVRRLQPRIERASEAPRHLNTMKGRRPRWK